MRLHKESAGSRTATTPALTSNLPLIDCGAQYEGTRQRDTVVRVVEDSDDYYDMIYHPRRSTRGLLTGLVCSILLQISHVDVQWIGKAVAQRRNAVVRGKEGACSILSYVLWAHDSY